VFDHALKTKKLPFRVVLMDSWYAAKDLMLHVHRADKIFYCTIKSNRKVDNRRAKAPYSEVSDLQWSVQDDTVGKLIKIQGVTSGNERAASNLKCNTSFLVRCPNAIQVDLPSTSA
jgi:hypothetical protein